MLKKPLIVLLSLLIALPSSAAASLWGALSMTAMEEQSHHGAAMHDLHGHQYHVAEMNHTDFYVADAHDHDREDCDEYCMSCSSHCSYSAVTVHEAVAFELSAQHSMVYSADISARTTRLYRPPISLQ